SKVLSGQKNPIEQISRGAACAVAGQHRFAAVRIENANVKIRLTCFPMTDDRDSIRASAVMPIADSPGKLAEIILGELLRLNHNVVVAVTVKLDELNGHSLTTQQLRRLAVRTAFR